MTKDKTFHKDNPPHSEKNQLSENDRMIERIILFLIEFVIGGGIIIIALLKACQSS